MMTVGTCKACIPVATVRRISCSRHGAKPAPFIPLEIIASHSFFTFENPLRRVPQLDGNTKPCAGQFFRPATASSSAVTCLLSGMRCGRPFFDLSAGKSHRLPSRLTSDQSKPITSPRRWPVKIISRNAGPYRPGSRKLVFQAQTSSSVARYRLRGLRGEGASTPWAGECLRSSRLIAHLNILRGVACMARATEGRLSKRR